MLRKSILILFVFALLMSAPFLAQAQERRIPNSLSDIQLSFAPLVEQSAQSVVNIYAERIVERRLSPFFNDPFFEHFFGGPMMGRSRPRVENSLGSGVIVRKDGLIITNAHVADGAKNITVVLNDRREFKADVVLVDEKSDLALIQIKTDKDVRFTPIKFGNMQNVKVGDLVMAIGNPFGVGQTVTSGIVSAVARTLRDDDGFGYFIQTDAAVNPGNSGGALIDIKGQLIGINTMIFSKSGASHGVGFAVPVDLVAQMLRAFESDGRLRRPWLGASLQDIDNDIAEAMELMRPAGVLVKSLFDGGPLAQAGLEVGDVIISINNQDVYDQQGLRYHIATLDIGQKVEISFIRDQEIMSDILLVSLPPEDPPRNEALLEGAHPLAGATVVNISPAVLEEMQINYDPELAKEGVMISKVNARATARRVGAQEGDIIQSINGVYIKSVAQLQKTLDNRKTRRWRIQLKRGAQVITTVISQ